MLKKFTREELVKFLVNRGYTEKEAIACWDSRPSDWLHVESLELAASKAIQEFKGVH